MRKFLLVLMALCLAVVPALAETAAVDFGAFTLTFPAEMQGQVAEKIVENEAFVTLYQMDDMEDSFASNLNIVWSESVVDLASQDPAAYAQAIVDASVAMMEQQNVAVANPTVLGASMDEIGGKAALSVMYSMDVDYTNAGLDLQTTLTWVQGIVSEEGLGTYTFTITTDNVDGCQPLVDIVNSTVWAE